MNEREARMIGAIVCTADDGCSECAHGLLGQLARHFPEWSDAWDSAWRDWNKAGSPGILGGHITFNPDGSLPNA